MTRMVGFWAAAAVSWGLLGAGAAGAQMRSNAVAAVRTPSSESALPAPSERPDDFGGKVTKALRRVLGPVAGATSALLRVIDLRTGKVLAEEGLQPNKRLYAASSIKTLLTMALLRRLDRIRSMSPTAEKTKLEQLLYKPRLVDQLRVKVPITQLHTNVECKRFRERRWRCHEDWDGRLYGPYVRGVKRQIRQLIDDMMWISSNNVAGSQLLDLAIDKGGRNELGWIRETAELITAPNKPVMQLVRKFRTYGWPGSFSLGRGDNWSNAADYVTMYEEIATGRKQVLTEESRAFLNEVLRRQTTESKLNFHWKKEATFFHKSGHSTNGLSDGGFFYVGKNKLAIMALFVITLDKKIMQRAGNVMFRAVEKKFPDDVARVVYEPAFPRW